MLETLVAERLAPNAGGRGLFARVLKITVPRGIGRRTAHGRSRCTGNGRAGQCRSARRLLAVLGQIELHLTRPMRRASARPAPRSMPRPPSYRPSSGRRSYSSDGRNLEAVVGRICCRERGLTIAVAESCTGGCSRPRLTDVPGSSDYVERGVVCYSNRSKTELVGRAGGADSRATCAVSEPVVRAMADGVRERAGTSIGIGVTGIAGPRRRHAAEAGRHRRDRGRRRRRSAWCGRFNSSAVARW